MQIQAPKHAPGKVLDYSEAASQKMILTGFLDLYARKRKPI